MSKLLLVHVRFLLRALTFYILQGFSDKACIEFARSVRTKRDAEKIVGNNVVNLYGAFIAALGV